MRLIDADLLKQNCKITGEFDNHFQCVDLITLGQVIDNQPTLDEKEIIRKAFERVVERLEEKTEFLKDCTKYGNKNAKQQEKSYSTMMMYEIADLVEDLVDIVKEECGISE